MQVIGIDPAPTKGLDVFDGRDHRFPLAEGHRFIVDLRKGENVLICWDAPLTGPGSAVLVGGEPSGSAFSQRPIEQFFSRHRHGFKVPSGISVLGYSGCSHWTISRSFLGYPRVGPYDAPEDVLPFRLLITNSAPQRGRWVVEVHPAVAIWLWCREMRGPDADWKYKGHASLVTEIWEHLIAVPAFAKIFIGNARVAPVSDDQLDARVAYALGRLWLEASDEVVLLGDLNAGTFLIPRVEGLVEAFDAFIEETC